MSRITRGILLVAVWMVSSVIMVFLALFSVNERIITICAVVALSCLLTAGFSFAERRYVIAFLFAAAPGIMVIAFLMAVGLLLGL